MNQAKISLKILTSIKISLLTLTDLIIILNFCPNFILIISDRYINEKIKQK